MLSVDCKTKKQKLYSLLNENQKKIHQKIVEERKTIYFKGYGIGLILSSILIFVYKYVINDSNKKKLSNWMIVCMVGAITFTSNYLYYILSPKTTYMVQHLDNKEQINEWLKIYRTMQVKYHTGLVLGIVAIMIFAYANRC
tara:strand:- start:354 stop:776 length:423 start_codon:yes stop_codon:yes gene_type:complete